MDYLKRQFKLWKFVQILKEILNDLTLATYKLQRRSFYTRIKDYYFSRENPLEDKENKMTFPVATKQFKDAIPNGHNLDSMKRNLDFLQREFGDYFDQLVQEGVLVSDNDYPPSYSLNHNSPKVYWVLGVMSTAALIWGIVKIFVSTE
ncbi:MAG TPA: hypothetical protein ENH86_00380 [Candidatus Jorgensenbacteria bacterium]|nr:hypothetical protein [Candidatus Jorgensenbacteria bacterium]